MTKRDSYTMPTPNMELFEFKTPRGFAVSIDDWTYIKDKVNSIADRPRWYNYLFHNFCVPAGSVFFGVCVTLFAQMLIGYFNPSEDTPFLWRDYLCHVLIAGFSLIVALIFFSYGFDKTKYKVHVASEVVEEMSRIEKRYRGGELPSSQTA